MCLEPIIERLTRIKNIKIILDCNNIAYSRNNKLKPPSLSDILLVYELLKEKLHFKKKDIICICDPALKYRIDKPLEYKVLKKEGILIEAPKVADEFILSYALKYDFCLIISNDKFREYIEQLPNKRWIEDRRISFLLINDEICLSPNIEYSNVPNFPENKEKINQFEKIDSQISTLDVLKRIEHTKGEFDLY